MGSKLTVQSVPEKDFDSWDRFIADSPAGSIYSTPQYLDCLCAAAGGSFELLGVYRGKELVGGIGLYKRNSSYGMYIGTRLLLYYNGPVIRNYPTGYPSVRTSRELAILAALEESLSHANYAHIELNCRTLSDVRPFLAKGWGARPSYSYLVSIQDIDSTWSRIEQNLRRLVKRFEDAGGYITEDDDFDSFFQMHLETHRRKGAPLYLTSDAYRSFVQRLKSAGLARLYHARLSDGRPAASQLVLTGSHPVTHTVCAGADEEFLNLGSTPFLRWKVFEDLARLGYEANDLTSAWLNPVTRFKSQLGGDLVTNLSIEKTPSRAWRLQRRLPRLKPFIDGLVRLQGFFRSRGAKTAHPGS